MAKEEISPKENQEIEENQGEQESENLSVSEITPQPPKPWLKIILFSILGLVVVMVLVYAGYQLGQKQAAILPTPTPTPTLLVPLPLQNETTNWSKYSNSQYGFQIKYPKSWTVKGENVPKLYSATKGLYQVANGEVGLGSQDNDQEVIEITICDLTKPEQEQYFKENLDSALQKEMFLAGANNFQKFVGVNLNVAPEKFMRLDFLTLKSNDQKTGVKIQVGSKFGSAVDEELLKQIIATFKFLD